MIKRWKINNFKSFKDTPPIDLSNITILAGANSSGKSSIIQSILLLKQHIQYGSSNRPITLNGPLLRLGAFEDVRHFDAGDSDLSIGFDIEISEEDLRSPSVSWNRYLRRYQSHSEVNPARLVRLDLSFNKWAGEAATIPGILYRSNVVPQLVSTELAVKRGRGEDLVESFMKFKLTMPMSEESQLPQAQYTVALDENSLIEVSDDKPGAKISHGLTSYFFPRWVSVEYNSTARDAVTLARYIVGDIYSARSFIMPSDVVSDSVVSVVNNWLSERGRAPLVQDDAGVAITAEDLHDAVRNVSEGYRVNALSLIKEDDTRATLATLRRQIEEAAQADRVISYDSEYEAPSSVDSVSEFIKDYFKQGIRYLGPLRDSPRPVYQPEALESTTDVGYRGEHTAAVLDLNAASRVRYFGPPSDNLDDDYVSKGNRKSAPLREAVVEWLAYLGVAENVITTDAGVFGNRLQVSTGAADRLHDLTNVGVGVSQVLPLVVTSLLAPSGSLLIFEQPELHLHPRVQARLADLFLALAKDGKQTLLETHSEYLIDRLRLRIALSNSDSVRPLVSILFTEKSKGKSSLTPIDISEFGSITNWPKDFFDQSQSDVARLIKVASEKRRAQMGKK